MKIGAKEHDEKLNAKLDAKNCNVMQVNQLTSCKKYNTDSSLFLF